MKAAILSSFSKRFRGLLPGSPARDSSFAVFVPCRDIHTFGMDAPIDVALPTIWAECSCRGAR